MSLAAGEALRDAGISLVLNNESAKWKADYLTHAANYLRRHRFVIGEEIRFYVQSKVGDPHHPNTWGAMFNELIREEWVRQTNEWQKPVDRRSHARPTRFWRSLIYVSPTAEPVEVFRLPGSPHTGKS